MNARPLLLGLAALSPAYGLDYFWNLGTNGNWSDPSRWGPLNQVPDGAGNTVELFVDTVGGHVGGPIHTITMDGSYSLDGFTHISDTCQLYASGRTFTINGPSVLDGHLLTFAGGSNYVTNGTFTHSSGHFDLLSSSLTGSGSYTLGSGTALFNSATLSVPVSQTDGGLTLLGPTVFNNGYSSTGGTIGFDATGHLNIHNADWNNGGAFSISNSGSNISINTGTGQSLINLPTGTITFLDTTAARSLTLHLDNRGTLNLNQANQALSVPTASGTHSNSGTIHALGDLLVDNAETFDNSGLLNSTGGYLRFEGTSSATSSWSNSGTVNVNDGLWVYRFENITNTGLIDIDNGNTTFTTSQYSNQQPFTNDGDIDVAPGTYVSFANNGSGTGRVNLLAGSTLTGGGDIHVSNQHFDIHTAWQPGTSPIFLTNDTLTGTGSIETMDGIAATVTSTGIGIPFSNHGDLSWNGVGNVHGGLVNEVDGTLILEESSRLNLDDQDVINHGTLTYASAGNPSYIQEADTGSLGSFVNSPTGILVAEGPGTRYIQADFDNQGSATFNSTSSLFNSGGEHSNSGTLTANANFSATSIESFDNSGTFDATAGTLTFQGNSSATSTWSNSGTFHLANGMSVSRIETKTNPGTLNVDAGSAVFYNAYYGNQFPFTNTGDIVVDPGATFYCTVEGSGTGLVTLAPGSTLGGGGNVSFYSQSVDVQGPWSPGTSPLSLNASTLTGAGSLTITDNIPVTFTNTCSLYIPVNHHGDVSVNNITRAYAPFTNEADATFTLESGGRLYLDDDDFTNHGQFEFAAGTAASYLYEADAGSLGRFVNSATGTFTINGTGTRNLQVNLDNQGQADFHTNTNLNNSGGEHTNSGTLTSNANLTASNVETFTNSGTFHATAGTLGLSGNSSTTSTFTNTGTLTLDNGMALSGFNSRTNSGTLHINAGTAVSYNAYYGNQDTFTNNGDIVVDPGATFYCSISGSGTGLVALASGSTLGGGGNVSFYSQSVDVQGPWSPGTSPLSLNNTTLTGAGSLTLSDNIPNTFLNTCYLYLPVSHHGDASLVNILRAYAPFTNEADATFTLESGGRLYLNDDDFTNHGQFEFAPGTAASYLYEADAGSLGRFVNSPTGTFTINGTGTRNLQVNLDNRGQADFHTNTNLNNTGGEHTNSGTLTSNANLTASNLESFTNSGTFHATAGTQTFTGNNAATSSFTNSGTLTLATGMSSSQFGSQANTGLIEVTGGTASIATAWYNNPQPFTNDGDIDVAPGASVGFYRAGTSGTGQMILMPGSTLEGGGQINVTNTSVDVQDAWSPGTSPLSLNNTTLTGAGSLSITDDVPATFLNTCYLYLPVSHHGDASLVNILRAYAPFTNEADATFTLESGGRLYLNDDDFTNHGQFEFAPGTAASYLYEADAGSLGRFVNSPTGTFTINGTGTRNLQVNLDNQGQADFHTNTNLNNTGGEHTNSGTLTSNANLTASNVESFTNSGTFHATAGTQTFTGNNAATSSFTNSGTLTLATGMSSSQFGSQANAGLIEVTGGTASIATAWYGTPQPFTNDGTIDVGTGAAVGFYRAGTFGTGSATNETSGRITGSGTVNVSNTTFTNHGTIAPGNSTGVLTIGAMTHTATSVFEIEIADASGPGSGHDQVVVNGNLALNGTLEITRIGAYVPTPSDSFVIMTCTGELTGNFASVVQSDPAGTWEVEVDEDNDQVVLTFIEDPTLDYAGFQEAYFTPAEIANGDADPEVDFDGDGLVNLLEWIHGFDPKSGIHPVAPLAVERTPGTLDLIYPESALLPENAYSVTVLTGVDLAGGFATIPALDVTRLADTPVPGHPNLHLVTLRLDNTNWNAEDARFFQLEFAAAP